MRERVVSFEHFGTYVHKIERLSQIPRAKNTQKTRHSDFRRVLARADVHKIARLGKIPRAKNTQKTRLIDFRRAALTRLAKSRMTGLHPPARKSSPAHGGVLGGGGRFF